MIRVALHVDPLPPFTNRVPQPFILPYPELDERSGIGGGRGRGGGGDRDFNFDDEG